MRSKREPGVQIKTQAQLAKMEEAGRVVASALHAAADAVAPGVTTADLDAIASAQIAAAGAAPLFLGYHGFPATICTCINEEIVHGIPSSSRVLAVGDQLGKLGGDNAYPHGQRRVGVPAVEAGAAVDGDHVALP